MVMVPDCFWFLVKWSWFEQVQGSQIFLVEFRALCGMLTSLHLLRRAEEEEGEEEEEEGEERTPCSQEKARLIALPLSQGLSAIGHQQPEERGARARTRTQCLLLSSAPCLPAQNKATFIKPTGKKPGCQSQGPRARSGP
uniref:Uncharacterized protein n=1 Tax=Knipowitschia caucasica TaxID=637954 RepID=A0AAV2JH28_KNICA